MGLQDPPPQQLIDKLNKYMISRNYPTMDDVKDLPLDEYNKRGNTSCALVIEALSNLKEVKYYEDVHLIGSKLWNWALPDLEYLKETILTHFRAMQRVFNSMPKSERGRNSALGIQFRLCGPLVIMVQIYGLQDSKVHILSPNSPELVEVHMQTQWNPQTCILG